MIQSASSQEGGPVIEELQQKLKAATIDSEKVRYLYRLGDTYMNIDLEKAAWYADTAMKKAIQIKWKRGIASVLLLKGQVLSTQGKTAAALQEYQKSYKISSERNDRKMMSAVLNNIATIYVDKADYVNGYRYFEECLRLAESINDDKMIGLAYQNIGNIFALQKEFEKSIAYTKRGLVHSTAASNDNQVADGNFLLGSTYATLNDHTKAKAAFDIALSLYKKTENLNGIASTYTAFGFINDKELNKDSALVYYLKAQKVFDAYNPKGSGSIVNLGNIGYTYFQMAVADSLHKLSKTQRRQYLQKANTYTEKSIQYAVETNDKENEYYFLTNLAGIKEHEGDYKAALEYITRSSDIRDSIYSQENRNKIAAIENREALASRDKQIQINKLALSAERRTRTALIVGAILLLIIGGMLSYQNQNRRKTNTTLMLLNSELDEANKIKTKFFGILSHDLRSPIVNLVNFLHLQKEMPEIFDANRKEQFQTQLTIATEALLDNMEGMLLWSKSQMDRFEPTFQSIPVTELFAELQKVLPIQTPVNIRFENPGTIAVSSDPDYLKSIMYNLTINAIRALNQTENPQIVWNAVMNADVVQLNITDNGPGILPEQANALFNESNSIGAKHGLGMHLVRDLAKAIHCRIQLNTPVTGTSFALLLKK